MPRRRLQGGEDHRAGGERPCALLADPVLPCEDGGRGGRELLERVVELDRADPCARDPLQGARAAADRERRAGRRRIEAVEVALDLDPGLLHRVLPRWVLREEAAREPLRAEVDRTRPRRSGFARADDHLRRAAADVDDGHRAPARDARARDRAEERELALLGRGENARRACSGALKTICELGAVCRLPAGARDQHLDRLDAGGARIPDEPGHHRGGLCELLGRDLAVALDVRAEPEHLALREHRATVLGHEQANGVRPDVDDPDRHVDMVTTPHDGRPNAPWPAAVPARACA